MATYRIYSYDVWGNKKDGFEVNDVFRTAYTVELDGVDDDAGIVKAMKDCGWLKKGLHVKSVEIDGDDETLYVNDARDGMPACELRKEKETS